MKYKESFYNKKKIGGAYYVVIAFCLLLIGGASWFALSKFDNQSIASTPSEKSDEYKDNTSSYIKPESEVKEPIEPIESTAQKAEKEPYTESKTETTSKEPEQQISYTMPTEGEILKNFSEDTLQYSNTYGDMRFHKGIDISCKYDTQIFACADGKVTDIVNDTEYGTTVIIEHYGGIIVKYSAFKEVKVKSGDTVKMGDAIGTCTTIPSECNDKSHIHIEAYKNGKQISPLKAFGLE